MRVWGIYTSSWGCYVLIIRRYVDETILIGDDILVLVVDIRGKQVRLGIEAPPGLSIKRGKKKN
jgi:carbon storage regulator CsrA